jgi:hypothetical protein
MIEASPGKKLARLILANKLGVVVQGMILWSYDSLTQEG